MSDRWCYAKRGALCEGALGCHASAGVLFPAGYGGERRERSKVSIERYWSSIADRIVRQRAANRVERSESRDSVDAD